MLAQSENTSDNNNINNDDATMNLRASSSKILDPSYQLDCKMIKVKIINYGITNRHILTKLHRIYKNFEHSIRLFIEKDHKMAYIYFSTSQVANMAKISNPELNLYGHTTSVELTNENHRPRDDYHLEAIYSSNKDVSPDLDQHMSKPIDDKKILMNVTSRNTHLLPSPELSKPVFQSPFMYPALRPRYLLHGSRPPNHFLHRVPNRFMPPIASQHPMYNNEGFKRGTRASGFGPQTLTSNIDITRDLREELNRRNKERCNQLKNNNSHLSMQQNISNSDFFQSAEKLPNHLSTGNHEKSGEWLRMILCKDSQFPAKLYFITGDKSVIQSAITDENSTSTFRLTLRLRFNQILLKDVQKMNVHAILLAKSCSSSSVSNYDTSIKIMPLNYLVKYFNNLEAVGVKPLVGTCSEKSNKILLAFPLCEYTAALLEINYESWMTESDDNFVVAIVSEKCVGDPI